MAPGSLANKLYLGSGSKVLIFMPHPDDEAVFLSAVIRQLLSHNINIRIITLTQGEASTLRFGLKPEDNLAVIRKQELQKALSILHIRDFNVLNYPDGQLSSYRPQLESLIRSEIQSCIPNLVITLEPQGIYGHPDHIALSQAVTCSVKKPVRLAYATIPGHPKVTPLKPNLIIKLSVLDKIVKLRAISAHRSQFNFKKTKPEDFNFFKSNGLLKKEYLHVK